MASAYLEKEHRIAWVTRLLGCLNLFFAGVGTIALLFNIVGFLGLPSSFTEGLARFSYRMDIVSVILLSALAYAGIQLLRRSSWASLLCSVVFGAEIIFLLVLWLLWRLPVSPVSTVAIEGGFMNLGLALQTVTGYPVIGLILLRLSQHHA